VIVIRRARVEDAGTLLKLARMVHFINLPADKELIDLKITQSRLSFLRAASGERPPGDNGAARKPEKPVGVTGLSSADFTRDIFMFVAESREDRTALGTSQVLARMGGPGNPNYSFKLEQRSTFAPDLKTGTTHVVARLHGDETGPTEIGGLILQPASRGHRVGRFLSFVRFHFIALHRHLFADRILAEMMAPITEDGRSLLWEYLGRRFIPLSYTEADKQCQRSRKFIPALLPSGDIYLSLLPPEARDVVGEVGPETVPARRMLERLGFQYTGFVDPFDGGPLLETRTDDVPIIRATREAELGEPAARSKCRQPAMVSTLHQDGEFYAVQEDCCIDSKGRVCLPREAMESLHGEPGMAAGYTDMASIASDESPPARGGAKRRAKAGARP